MGLTPVQQAQGWQHKGSPGLPRILGVSCHKLDMNQQQQALVQRHFGLNLCVSRNAVCRGMRQPFCSAQHRQGCS